MAANVPKCEPFPHSSTSTLRTDLGLLSCTNSSNMEDVLMFIQLNPNFPSCTTSCLHSIRATRKDQFVGHVHKCRHPDRSEVPTAVTDWKTSMKQRVCRSTWAAGAAHFANATHVAGWTSVSWAQDRTKRQPAAMQQDGRLVPRF